MLDIAVREFQFWIVHVEFQRVADAAIFLERDLQMEHAGGFRLVAIVAVELVAKQRPDVRRREVQLVIELERVRVGKFFGDDLKLGMVSGERVDDFRVAVIGPVGFENDPSLRRAKIKLARRQFFSYFKRELHFVRVRVAGKAVCIRRRFHQAAADMLQMAGRAGMIARHVRFVEGVADVAVGAIPVNGIHRWRRHGGESAKLEWPGRRVKTRGQPAGRPRGRDRVASGATGVALIFFRRHFRERLGGMLR